MNYKIVSEYSNGTLVEVLINDVPYQTLVVCNDGEMDSAVESFVDSINNPKTFTNVEQTTPTLDSLMATIQQQQEIIDQLKQKVGL